IHYFFHLLFIVFFMRFLWGFSCIICRVFHALFAGFFMHYLCYDLAPHLFFFSITCPVMSFPLPHLVLTITAYLVSFTLTNPFTKPRTVLLSIHLFLSAFLPTSLVSLPIALLSYQFLVARILGCTILRT